MDIVLTEIEKRVLAKLHERVAKITGGKDIPQRLVKSVIISCCAWSFPVIFEDEVPEEVALACKSLVAKGMVVEYEDRGYPSFVPSSENTMIEYNYREFTQSDAR